MSTKMGMALACRTQDAEARKRMIMINVKGSVPTALINGKKVVGFSEKTYRKMLSQ